MNRSNVGIYAQYKQLAVDDNRGKDFAAVEQNKNALFDLVKNAPGRVRFTPNGIEQYRLLSEKQRGVLLQVTKETGRSTHISISGSGYHKYWSSGPFMNLLEKAF